MSFRIDPRLPLTGEVRRILTDEIGKALGHLETARDKPEQGLHKCRKRLKSIRALLRLVRSGDEPFCQTENECYKQVSALLAGPREATALIETIDRLAEAFFRTLQQLAQQFRVVGRAERLAVGGEQRAHDKDVMQFA
ncbi:MAG: CHAD domain-containing protein, partial [Mesorhizobium sp.]